jgi:hypothetical protein
MLPLRSNLPARQTHDYVRHATSYPTDALFIAGAVTFSLTTLAFQRALCNAEFPFREAPAKEVTMSNSPPKSILKGRWYFVVTVCSAGLLAWLPFVHAGHHLHRRSVTRLVWIYAATAVLISTLAALTPRDASGEVSPGAGDTISLVGGFLAIATIALGCVQQAPLRRAVYSGTPLPERDAMDPALAAALGARKQRVDARLLAAQDPLLARDLKIGRPDLPHTFDDGGLVDLNSAPPQVIATTCGLPRSTGDTIATARPPGGFMAVDDVFSLTDIPIAAWDTIRDRAVTIPRPD